MALKNTINLKQKQNLKLSQKTYQAIEYLKLDQESLLDKVQQASLENPYIQEDENTIEVEKHDILNDTRSALLDPNFTLNQFDITYDHDDNYSRNVKLSLHTFLNNKAEAGSTIEATKANEDSTITLLEEQIRLSFIDKKQRAVAMFWLSKLDENFRLSQNDFLIAKRLNFTDKELIHILRALQLLDPVGCFARNVEECFLVQLQDMEIFDKVWLKILQNIKKLKKITDKDFAQSLGIEEAELQKRLALLKKLSPYPLTDNSDDEQTTVAIEPELIVRKNADSLWLIELNKKAFPDIVIATLATEKLKRKMSNKDKKWLDEKKQEINFLENVLANRAYMIENIGKYILEHQVMFFEKGITHLQPMRMKDVAKTLNIHESTVSRLVRGKYLEYYGGKAELRWFFNTGSSGSNGESMSNLAVSHVIKKIIETENIEKPYSDQLISEKLKQRGINIARRTVAKYRENIDIPSASQRKRIAKNNFNVLK